MEVAMKRIILLIVVAMAVISALIIGAKAVGSTAIQSPLALFSSEQCGSRLCWNGIRIGQTTITEATAILERDGRPIDAVGGYRLCSPGAACWDISIEVYRREPTDPVRHLALTLPVNAITLGDLLCLYGTPTTAQMCPILGNDNGNLPAAMNRPMMASYFTFRGGIRAVAFNAQQPMARHYEPSMTVYKLYFESTADIFVDSRRWAGFARSQRDGCNRG
jgi:hypothetical protein